MSEFVITVDPKNKKDITIEDPSVIYNYIQKIEGKKSSTFFSEEYKKANAIVNNIISAISVTGHQENNSSENSNDDRRKSERSSPISEDNDSTWNKNNIIIFSGDRGTGKTSAMVSFGEFLAYKQGGGPSDYKLLDMIDPSYFRKNESILLNVITIMFQMVKKEHEKRQYRYNENLPNRSSGSYINAPYNENSNFNTQSQNRFNELLKRFEHVFRAVKRMDSIIPKEDTLEYLNELSDATELEDQIQALVHEFLFFFHHSHKYLVIMIDDLDMNVSYATTMLEQIRKFLILRNVIILIATNIDQLQFEMKESYSKYYDKISQPSLQTPHISIDVEEMATKYLLKLFPPLQRIHINNVSNRLLTTKLKIEGKIEDNLQTLILNLIWKKTRLIFIPEENQLHPLIPLNLRALSQFIYLLLDMEDVECDQEKGKLFTDEKSYSDAQKNFSIFKDYILNVWIPSNVSFEEKKVFDNIPKDIKRINKHLIQSINIIASKYKNLILIKENEAPKESVSHQERNIYTFVSSNDPKFPHANKISDIFNFPTNNSAGDIFLLIDKYKTTSVQNNFY